MLGLDFGGGPERDCCILCLGAHSDDIEIGAGATVLALAERFPAARIEWVVFSGHGERAAEAQASAEHFTSRFAEARITVHAHRDGGFPAEIADIKARFETLKGAIRPDIVLTHYRGDLHQDHRLVSDLTWQTFRDHLILEYEIPKYDGDFGVPNVFVPVSDERRRAKLRALESYFPSQAGKRWFSRELFEAAMRLRGMECNSPTSYAEAFYCRKVVLGGTEGSER